MTSTESETKSKRRFEPHELVLSELTEDDLLSVAEGYYAAFPTDWFATIEPPHTTEGVSLETRQKRYAERMRPWLKEPGTRWTKVTISPRSAEYDPENPNKVIGHAGWLTPERTVNETINFWRRDAADLLGWREKMGWSKDYEDELWSHVDIEAYSRTFIPWDKFRGHLMRNTNGHWFLAPLWVIPAHQGRGVSSVLLRDAIQMADADGKKEPMYLEAMKSARPIYKHFGFDGVVTEIDNVMVRNAPEDVQLKEEESE